MLTWTNDDGTTGTDGKCAMGDIPQTAVCAVCKAEVHRTVKGDGQHNLVKTEKLDATCTVDGNTEYWQCTICQTKFKDADGKEAWGTNGDGIGNEVIPATGHNMTAHEANNATCTEDGNEAYWTCSKCNKSFKDGAEKTTDAFEENEWVIAAKGHELTETEASEATCTTAGNKAYWTCSVCEKLFSDEEGKTATTADKVVIAAKGHEIEQHVERKDATCMQTGNLEYWTCKNCDSKLKANSPTAEVYAEDVETAGGYILSRDLNAHNLIWDETTRTENRHWQRCTNEDADGNLCPEQHVNETGHRVTGWTYQEDTGKYFRSCKDCGQDFIWDKVPNHEHTFGGEYIAVDGGHVQKCINPNYPNCMEVSPVGGHDTEGEPIPAVAATCLSGGLTEGKTCSKCGAVTVPQEGTEALGHSWGPYVTVSDTLRVSTCADCGATRTITVRPSTDPGTPITPTEPDTGDTTEDEGLTDIDDERAPLAGLPFDLAPTDELTRGLFAEILYWYEGEPEPDGEAPFTDVEGHEYAQAITWGAVNGVLLGYDDDTYRPDNAITRGEMEAILKRYVQYKQSKVVVDLSGDDTDVMLWLEAEEIIDNFFAALAIEAE